MDATIKVTGNLMVIRMANGAAVSNADGFNIFETYQAGGKLLYRGGSVVHAVQFAINAQPVPTGKYTYRDSDGMLWRMEGSRPISQLADDVMNNLQPMPESRA